MTSLKDELDVHQQGFLACYAKGDNIGAVAAYNYTEDCKILAPGHETMVGTKAAEEMVKTWIQSGMKIKTLKIVECFGDGNSAWSLLDFKCEHPNGKVDFAKNVLTYKKINGKWSVHFDIWNSNK